MIRRRHWCLPEADPEERRQAAMAVEEAYHRLNSVLARQPEVDEAAGVQQRIRRENHMAPRISRALGAYVE